MNINKNSIIEFKLVSGKNVVGNLSEIIELALGEPPHGEINLTPIEMDGMRLDRDSSKRQIAKVIGLMRGKRYKL